MMIPNTHSPHSMSLYWPESSRARISMTARNCADGSVYGRVLALRAGKRTPLSSATLLAGRKEASIFASDRGVSLPTTGPMAVLVPDQLIASSVSDLYATRPFPRTFWGRDFASLSACGRAGPNSRTVSVTVNADSCHAPFASCCWRKRQARGDSRSKSSIEMSTL